jgi:putative ubiquitin-RnfH superfamily antitoxin RatB of RatAB toxin-antitoxin module
MVAFICTVLLSRIRWCESIILDRDRQEIFVYFITDPKALRITKLGQDNAAIQPGDFQMSSQPYFK